MLEKLEKYYEYYDIEKPNEPFSVIQNPGAKTVDSLMNKVVRGVEIQGRRDYSFADVTDMARCAILFDSYSEIPDFLRSLKSKSPTVSGYVSRFSSGYKGIHLNFQIDGCSVEIQLSIQKAWEVKQLTEHCYSKWRGFNEREKFSEIMQQIKIVQDSKSLLDSAPANKQLQEEYNTNVEYLNKLKHNLQENLQLQKLENQMTNDLYKELHNDGQFASIEEEVESLLLSYEINKEDLTVEKPFLTEPFRILENGKLDMESLKERATEVNAAAQKIQTQIIEVANNTLQEKDHHVELDSNIVKSSKMIENIMDLYNEKLESLIGSDINLINENIGAISYQRYNIAVGATKFAIKNNMLEEEAVKVLSSFYAEQKQNSNFKNGRYDLVGLAEKITSQVREKIANI